MIKKINKSIVSGSIKAPSSKSYAQRAIAASLLTEGESRLLNMELCRDTCAALKVAEALGAKYRVIDESTYLIRGGLNPITDTIDIGESGLSARMFTPIAALCDVPITITGGGTISGRPMDMLIKPLQELGVTVKSEKGGLPITLQGPMRGGETTVDGEVSSQFITGLLMALPLAEHDTTFQTTQLKSIPYIDMTLDTLERFGIEGKHNGYTEFFVEGGQRYKPQEYNIEGDWSGASCILVAGAIAGVITVTNLNPLSKQADVALIDALFRAGAEITTTDSSVTVRNPGQLNAFTFDATHCPDLFPALVALAANCEGETVLIGTERLKYKESNRAETLKEEFGKMGIYVDISESNIMRIFGGKSRGAVLDSHNDHRIAMSVAVAALNAEGEVIIEGAESVDKSYPAFWRDLDFIVSK